MNRRSQASSCDGFHPRQTSGLTSLLSTPPENMDCRSKPPARAWNNSHDSKPELAFPLRGLLFALPVSALLWMLIGWGVCHIGGK